MYSRVLGARRVWGTRCRASSVGDSNRRDISTTFVQLFLSYTTPTAWTYTLQSESTYDWEASDWQIPIRGVVTKVTRIGDQMVSRGGGVNYWLESPDSGPEGWGLRFDIALSEVSAFPDVPVLPDEQVTLVGRWGPVSPDRRRPRPPNSLRLDQQWHRESAAGALNLEPREYREG